MLANARHAKEEIQAMTTTTSGGDRQRRTVLRAMMIVTALGGLLFAVLNLHRGLWPAAVVEFAFVAYSLILLPIIGRTPRFRAWAVAYVIPWTGAMLSILAMPGPRPRSSSGRSSCRWSCIFFSEAGWDWPSPWQASRVRPCWPGIASACPPKALR
jgi:hypothetical protein